MGKAKLLYQIYTKSSYQKTIAQFKLSLTWGTLQNLDIWTIDWGYRGTIAEAAWRSINNFVFQQLFIPGVKGIDR